MADTRSQEERAGGFIRCSVAGSTRNLPTLKIRAERAWRDTLANAIGSMEMEVDLKVLMGGGIEAYEAVAGMANVPATTVLELVLAYDATGALGGKEYLEENADSGQLYEILKLILGVVFPFVSDLRSVLTELVRIRLVGAAGPSLLSSSMSSLLLSGDSTPNGSKPHSTTPSSSPSGTSLGSAEAVKSGSG